MTTASVSSRSGRVLRLLGLLVIVVICIAASASSAFAAPTVTNAKFSNPVAYELKSLLNTRFTCNVDTTGTWGKLDIMGASGVVKTIYNGPMAIGPNWMPLWNGMDAAGKRLPSASYDWRLTVSKGAESTVVRGKITISKIHFIVSGHGETLSEQYYDRYMVPGTANIYYDLSNASYVDSLWLHIYEPSEELVGYTYWDFDENERIKGTLYLRRQPDNDTTVEERGIHTFNLSTANDVNYYFTVIQ